MDALEGPSALLRSSKWLCKRPTKLALASSSPSPRIITWSTLLWYCKNSSTASSSCFRLFPGRRPPIRALIAGLRHSQASNTDTHPKATLELVSSKEETCSSQCHCLLIAEEILTSAALLDLFMKICKRMSK